MCEAKVFVTENGEDKQVMEDVVLVQPEGDAFLLVSLLGEQKMVRGRIARIDFLKHRVHFLPVQEQANEPESG